MRSCYKSWGNKGLQYIYYSWGKEVQLKFKSSTMLWKMIKTDNSNYIVNYLMTHSLLYVVKLDYGSACEYVSVYRVKALHFLQSFKLFLEINHYLYLYSTEIDLPCSF